MRKLNGQANAPLASSSPTPITPPKEEMFTTPQPDKIVIDPGAKARNSAAGGQVDPIDDQAIKAQSMILRPGQTVWSAVVEELAHSITDPVWQTRHGSVLAIMEITRQIGIGFPSSSLVPLARHLLVLLAMDRFGDFVGDTVIAPVRETAAQALGVLMKYLDILAVQEAHETLIAMVRQDWAKRGGSKELGALMPIHKQVAERLSYEELSRFLDTLWDCLAAGEDELGSSTGAVMDLLGELFQRIPSCIAGFMIYKGK